jgi:hypothetical protein
LIDIRVHLVMDLFARLQAHQHELGVLAGEYYLPEVVVFQRLSFGRFSVTGHYVALIDCFLKARRREPKRPKFPASIAF